MACKASAWRKLGVSVQSNLSISRDTGELVTKSQGSHWCCVWIELTHVANEEEGLIPLAHRSP
jgi:hypothetical protein